MPNTEAEDWEYQRKKDERFFIATGSAIVLVCGGFFGLSYVASASNRRNDASFHADVILKVTPHQDSVAHCFPLTHIVEDYQFARQTRTPCYGERYHIDELMRLYSENPHQLSVLYADLLDKRYDCRKGIATQRDIYLEHLLSTVSDADPELSEDLFIAYVNCLAKNWAGTHSYDSLPPGPPDILVKRIIAPLQITEALESIFTLVGNDNCDALELATICEAARLLKNDDLKRACVEQYQQCIANKSVLSSSLVIPFITRTEDLKTPHFTIRKLFGEQTFEQVRGQVWLAYKEPEQYLKLIDEKTKQLKKEQ